MSAATTITKIAQTTLLCTGLIAANAVWSCPEGPGAANATNPAVSQAQTLFAADLYKLFHEAALNKPDGLGDYVQNFQPADRN